MLYYGIVITGTIVASFSQILLKKGAMRPHVSFIRDYLNVPVIAGYMMMMFSVVCSMTGLRGIDFLNVPVIEATGFVLVPVLSYIFFKEKFTKYKIAGIAFIIAGMIVYYI